MRDPTPQTRRGDEVANANFADQRLNKRLRQIVMALGANPKASLPRVFDSAGLEAAYRFFSNHRVMPNEILKGHFAATRTRVEGEDFIVLTTRRSSCFAKEDGGKAFVESSPTVR